jgi:hypothetical protein
MSDIEQTVSEMSHRPTWDELLQSTALEREKIVRPYQRAVAAEREITAARTEYWELLEEFVARARELDVQPQICELPSAGNHSANVSWIEGYPLSGGAVVSAPPLRYGTATRRRVFRPAPEVRELEELSLFVADHDGPGSGTDPLEQHTPSANWPFLGSLDETGTTLTALRHELEASLLTLMG